MPPVYVLGGYQTDFARNWSREGATIADLMWASVAGALEACDVGAGDIEVAHVGNFTGELFARQGHLGGIFAALDPAFHGLPTSRHEAACASGSVAALAAMADIEAGRYGLACVTGVELMRNVGGREAADYLGCAAWTGREAEDAVYVWPALFSDLADEYERRYGLDHRHLEALAELAYSNAKRNPNAQTRSWRFEPGDLREDAPDNPLIEGRTRKHDCGRVTDGSATVLLASAEVAGRWAAKRGRALSDLPIIQGWGHRTGTMRLADKLELSRDADYVFPHLKDAVDDARRRAGVPDAGDVGHVAGFEVHDCFTITGYMLLEHIGMAAPGQAWRAIEDGSAAAKLNPSGGLVGLGHPVGATGVRMLLDAAKQVAGTAGDYQVPGADRFQTVNIGGSATTVVSLVVGRG